VYPLLEPYLPSPVPRGTSVTKSPSLSGPFQVTSNIAPATTSFGAVNVAVAGSTFMGRDASTLYEEPV